jgi:hypothetical protein
MTYNTGENLPITVKESWNRNSLELVCVSKMQAETVKLFFFTRQPKKFKSNCAFTENTYLI